MEGNASSLLEQSRNSVTASPANGLLGGNDGSHTDMDTVYPPHSVAEKKKRGRPRKYDSPEQALAARKAANASSFLSPKKSHSSLLGNTGQGFTPHIITVAAGDDVGQKVMLFLQQSRREMCIISASGSISNAILSQPASSGGNIAYEGQFNIISLTGSYVHNELGGWSGGLSVCLSNSDGQFVGGSIAGPLKAAGPVQVIVGTFFMDTKKDTSAGTKGDDVSSSKLPPSVGEPVSSLDFRPAVDSYSRNTLRGDEEHQSIGGSHFMLQQCGVHVTPSHPLEWGSGPDLRNAGFDLTGRIGLGEHHSPENGNYDQIPD
ncbi:PPC domain [Sesbania bispinosa]|nr:PPC domain [Sesbania bispinosa]